MLKNRVNGRLIAVLLVLVCTTMTSAQAQNPPENPQRQQQPLGTDNTVTLWTTTGNKVPVCWTTAGFTREKQIVRQALADSWEYYADVDFTGWGNCPSSGEEQLVRGAMSSRSR